MVLTLNVLAGKPEEGPVSYCKFGVEFECNNRPGTLVNMHQLVICKRSLDTLFFILNNVILIVTCIHMLELMFIK